MAMPNPLLQEEDKAELYRRLQENYGVPEVPSIPDPTEYQMAPMQEPGLMMNDLTPGSSNQPLLGDGMGMPDVEPLPIQPPPPIVEPKTPVAQPPIQAPVPKEESIFESPPPDRFAPMLQGQQDKLSELDKLIAEGGDEGPNIGQIIGMALSGVGQAITGEQFLDKTISVMQAQQNQKMKDMKTKRDVIKDRMQVIRQQRLEDIQQNPKSFLSTSYSKLMGQLDPENKAAYVDMNYQDMAMMYPAVAKQAELKMQKRALEATTAKEQRDIQKETVKMEGDLRKEFTTINSDFKKVRDSYGRIIASAKDPSAAGDLAMIFNYMKMLDPGSVVRESEFANAAATGSYRERMKAGMARLLKGERLSEEMRADFFNRAAMLYEPMKTTYTQVHQQFTGLANAYGVNPERVAMDLETVEIPENMGKTGYSPQEYQKIITEAQKMTPGAVKGFDAGQAYEALSGGKILIEGPGGERLYIEKDDFPDAFKDGFRQVPAGVQ